jgi:hypothetical protein
MKEGIKYVLYSCRWREKRTSIVISDPDGPLYSFFIEFADPPQRTKARFLDSDRRRYMSKQFFIVNNENAGIQRRTRNHVHDDPAMTSKRFPPAAAAKEHP